MSEIHHAAFGDDQTICYGQQNDHVLFANPTGDPDVETPVFSFWGVEEMEWARDQLDALLEADDER